MLAAQRGNCQGSEVAAQQSRHYSWKVPALLLLLRGGPELCLGFARRAIYEPLADDRHSSWNLRQSEWQHFSWNLRQSKWKCCRHFYWNWH